MKSFVLCLIAVVLVTSGVIWLLASGPALPAPRAEHASSSVPAVSQTSAPKGAATSANQLHESNSAALTAPAAISAPSGTASSPLIEDREAAKEQLRTWAANFSPEELPKVLGYLDHADSEVRMAAAAALVLLGDGSAAPALLVAAEKANARNAEVEAATFREAAELLSRPNTMPMPAGSSPRGKLGKKVWSAQDGDQPPALNNSGAQNDALPR
jgi:hypothetical protein